jgi:hypothetical protein
MEARIKSSRKSGPKKTLSRTNTKRTSLWKVPIARPRPLWIPPTRTCPFSTCNRAGYVDEDEIELLSPPRTNSKLARGKKHKRSRSLTMNNRPTILPLGAPLGNNTELEQAQVKIDLQEEPPSKLPKSTVQARRQRQSFLTIPFVP